MRATMMRPCIRWASTSAGATSRKLATKIEFHKGKMEDLLKRRYFYDQSFSIYGGGSGLYDLGPMGCAVENNIIQAWRTHFILHDSMLELKCSTLTPEAVLKSSGHIERFTDWMVKDVVTGECFRADQLIRSQAEALIRDKKTKREVKRELEAVLQQLDGLSNTDMEGVIRRFDFKSPTTNNELSSPVPFNLMFPTQIGPVTDSKVYLRPETAQGIFVNFKRLFEFNQKQFPFAAAQIGSCFRNEISPRQGLLRVREFTIAEVEHFIDPGDKRHPTFHSVADLELNLLSACNQRDSKGPVTMPIGEAVMRGIVNNETLGYYMARTHLFLVSVGVDPKRLRFRQHLSNEMAHYAKDCWDAECHCSYGWIECAGCADRDCFDLAQHSKSTGEKLSVERRLDSSEGCGIEEIHPHVVEPSFGIGRIMYVVLEHAFRQREGDEKRNYLDLPLAISPVKCSVLPLSSDKRFDPILEAVRQNLIDHGMSQKTDTTGSSIGKRYARNDEIGIPFGVTIDFDSLEEPWTVTLRHAISMEQVRLKVAEVGETIERLVKGRMQWADVTKKFPVFGKERENG